MKLMRNRCGLAVVALLSLAGCDKPGPLSAAAKGNYPPPPAAPAWATPLAGRPLREAFPNTIRCLGFVDGVSDHYQRARKAYGWAWNSTAAQPIARVAVVDAGGRMVDFGEGGVPRQDVVQARPEVRSPTSGWSAAAPVGQSSTIFGLDVAARAACSLGVITP